MNAKEFLQQIEKLDKLIENKNIEAQQWREMARNTSPILTADKVQSTHNPLKIQDAICKYIDLENEINKDIDNLIDIKKDVLSVIEQLSAKEYDVLHKIYVQFLTYDEAAYFCKQSKSWVTTVHGRALVHVQNILDQRNTEIV